MNEKEFLTPEKFNERQNLLTPRARILYSDVRSLSQKHGYCLARTEFLMKRYDVSRSTLWRAVDELIKKRFVSKGVADTEYGPRRVLIPLVLPYTIAKNSCTENGTEKRQCTENGTEIFSVHCTENGAESIVFQTEYLGQKSDVKKDLKYKNVSKVKQNCFKNETPNVSNMKQKCFKNETHSIDIVKNGVKTESLARTSARAMRATIFDESGESIVLPNPYKEKEDGYRG